MAKKPTKPSDGDQSTPPSTAKNVVTIHENGITRTIDLDNPDSIAPEDIERISTAFGPMIAAKAPASAEKVTGADIASVVKAMESDESNISSEDIKKLTDAFGKMIVAEMRGEDISDYVDIEDFKVDVAPMVIDAIKKYSTQTGVDLLSVSGTNYRNVGDLLGKEHKVLDVNINYRYLVRDGSYRLQGHSSMFGKYNNGPRGIDKDGVEKAMRRVDAEIRNMDALDREELLFNFINAIHGADFGKHGVRITAELFDHVKVETKELLRALALFYENLHNHVRVSANGKTKVNNSFGIESIQSLITLSTNRALFSSNSGVEYSHISRNIRPKEYYTVLQLARALGAALPVNLYTGIEHVLNREHNLILDTTVLNVGYSEPSKYLRNAFVAISQGHGSFEAFFTAIHNFQSLLNKELNERISITRYMVGVYDALELDISEVLKVSTKRILTDSAF